MEMCVSFFCILRTELISPQKSQCIATTRHDTHKIQWQSNGHILWPNAVSKIQSVCIPKSYTKTHICSMCKCIQLLWLQHRVRCKQLWRTDAIFFVAVFFFIICAFVIVFHFHVVNYGAVFSFCVCVCVQSQKRRSNFIPFHTLHYIFAALRFVSECTIWRFWFLICISLSSLHCISF